MLRYFVKRLRHIHHYRPLHWLPERSIHHERFNEIDVQMLGQQLHEQIFKAAGSDLESPPEISRDLSSIRSSISDEFEKHNLSIVSDTSLSDVDIKIPPLHGCTLDEHFRLLAEKQCQPYKGFCDLLSRCTLPPKPEVWNYTLGWTMYKDGKIEAVTVPLDDILVFDVEVLQTDGEGRYPTLAVAASDKAW